MLESNSVDYGAENPEEFGHLSAGREERLYESRWCVEVVWGECTIGEVVLYGL